MPGDMSERGKWTDSEYHADYPTADFIHPNQTNASLVSYWQRNGSGSNTTQLSYKAGWQNVVTNWTQVWINSEKTNDLSGPHYASWNDMSKSH
jgi:hypothetical protein